MRARYLAPLLALLFITGCSDIAHFTYEMALSAEKARAGLQDKWLETEGGVSWHYLASENAADKPVVLLIHGFGADSSNWVRFANQLEGQYRFIIPDLPGHGDTSQAPDGDYSIERQAERLKAFMTQLGLPRYHVAGNSMGGAITIALTRQAPRQVLSMGLVDAAGLGEVTTAFSKLLEGGDNPLIPRSPEDFFTTLDWAMEKPPFMPDFLVRVMGKKKAENAAVAREVWADVSGAGHMDFSESLPALQTPALVLWGEEDRLLPVRSAHRFDELLPNSRKVILSGIGHVPMAETPSKTADAFRVFWLEVRTSKAEA